MPFLKDQLYKWPFSRFGILLRSFLKDLDAAVSFFKDQSMFIAASCIPSLVSKKWSKILCLGATLRLNLVELTPGLTLAVRMLIFPTKSSELNVQWVFGFKNFAFSSKCWNVWCFITMLNKVRPFSRAQPERWLYRLNFFPPDPWLLATHHLSRRHLLHQTNEWELPCDSQHATWLLHALVQETQALPELGQKLGETIWFPSLSNLSEQRSYEALWGCKPCWVEGLSPFELSFSRHTLSVQLQKLYLASFQVVLSGKHQHHHNRGNSEW